MPEENFKPVIRYLRQIIFYEAAMAVIASATVYCASSYTAVFPLLFAMGGVFCFYLMIYTVQAAAKGDPYHYPYGTGRLENISSIMLSVMLTVGALVPFVQTIQTLVSGNSHKAGMGWTTLLLLISSAGNFYQARRAQILHRSNGSPMLSSTYHGYHAGFVRDFCSFVLIGLCWIIQKDNQTFMSRLDSFSTIILTFYSFYHFLPQIWINFRSLADFPTSEETQLKIMGILAKYFDRYEQLGMIYLKNAFEVKIFI